MIKKYSKGQPCFQEHIFKHFNSPGHGGFLENVLTIFIDKTDTSKHKKQENYRVHRLKTMVPWRLNVK